MAKYPIDKTKNTRKALLLFAQWKKKDKKIHGHNRFSYLGQI